MKCLACDRLGSEGYWCTRHLAAARRLSENYSIWVHAYGELSWEDYLTQIVSNPNSGTWVIEVAKTSPTFASLNKYIK